VRAFPRTNALAFALATSIALASLARAEGEKPTFALEGHGAQVVAVAWAPDGKQYASGDADGTLCVWETLTRKRVFKLELDKAAGWVHALAFTSDGKQIACGCKDGVIRIVSASAGTSKTGVQAGGHAVYALAYSPDGKLLAAGTQDKTAVVFDAATLAPVMKLETHRDVVTSLAFSPDSKVLVTVGDTWVHFWDVGARKRLRAIESPQRALSVAVSPDGKAVVAATGTAVTVYDPAGEAAPRRIECAPDPVLAVAVSPDSKSIAAGQGNGRVVLLDLVKSAVVRRLDGVSSSASNLAFSPDGRFLLQGGEDKTLHVWNLRGGS
jgi:WD40 repeat protein